MSALKSAAAPPSYARSSAAFPSLLAAAWTVPSFCSPILAQVELARRGMLAFPTGALGRSCQRASASMVAVTRRCASAATPLRRGLTSGAGAGTKHVWSPEWEKISLGATPPWEHGEKTMGKVLFVEAGWGCDQHGDREGGGGTKAAVRACRNAIEFNSIPCIQDLVPGGRPNMKIKIRLGVPAEAGEIDLGAVCAVFPYGRILPIEVVQPGGLSFQSGRVVGELGDKEDLAVVVVAVVTVGF